MVYKNPEELSNAEIKEYMNALENEYEVIKSQIRQLCDSLDEMDTEYNKATEVLNKRRKGIV